MENNTSIIRINGPKFTKFIQIIAGAILLICSVSTANSYDSSTKIIETIQPDFEFSTYRGSNDRLGAYADKPILGSPDLINRFIIQKPTRMTPILSENYLYTGDEDGILYALDRQLLISNQEAINPAWKFEINIPIVSTSVLFDDRLYFGGLDGNVYAIDALTGDAISQFSAFDDIYSSPLLINDTLYIGSLDHQLYALSVDDLSKIWQTDLLDQVWSSPAWGDNGKIYVGSRSGNIFALDAETGSIIWQYETGGWVDATPAVYDGKVFVGSHDGIFYALDAEDGSVLWQHDTGQLIYSSAAVGVNYPQTEPTATDEAAPSPTAEIEAEAATTVYVNNYDGEVFAFDINTGDVLWQTSIGGPAYSSPVYVNGILYVITEKGGLLYALDAQYGSPRWTYVTGRQGDFRSASPVPYDGKLYVASNTEGLLVLGNPEDD